MEGDQMESSSEQQQRPHSAGTSVNMGNDSSKRAERSTESSDSGVSFKRVSSRRAKQHSLPRWEDFSSSEKKHGVSDDEDLDQEEVNQELSSGVGWKHLEAPVSSCS